MSFHKLLCYRGEEVEADIRLVEVLATSVVFDLIGALTSILSVSDADIDTTVPHTNFDATLMRVIDRK